MKQLLIPIILLFSACDQPSRLKTMEPPVIVIHKAGYGLFPPEVTVQDAAGSILILSRSEAMSIHSTHEVGDTIAQ